MNGNIDLIIKTLENIKALTISDSAKAVHVKATLGFAKILMDKQDG